MSVPLKPAPNTKPIDLSDWNFGSIDLEKLVAGAVQGAVENTLKEFPLTARLPAMWGDSDGAFGPHPENPLTIYVGLPLGKDIDEGPEWQFTLDSLFDDILSAFEQDGSFGEGLLRMRKALADLLKRIDDAMAYEQLNERNK